MLCPLKLLIISNQDDFLKLLKKKFKSHKIFTLDDNIQLEGEL